MTPHPRLSSALILTLPGFLVACELTQEGLPPCDRSSDCPAVAPLCDLDRHGCVPCAASTLKLTPEQRDSQCAERSAALGQGALGRCGSGIAQDTWGLCVACTQSSDCQAGNACWHGSCVPACADSSACASQVCARFDAEAETGACVPPAEVILVDRSSRSANPDGQSQQSAYSSLDAAIAAVRSAAGPALRASAVTVQTPPSRRAVLRLLSGGDYGSLRPAAVPPGFGQINTFLIFGPKGVNGRGRAQLGYNPDTRETLVGVVVNEGVQIYLDSVDIIDPVVAGVRCLGRRPALESGGEPQSLGAPTLIALRGVNVSRSTGVGLEATYCDVKLEQVRLDWNFDSALVLWGPGQYAITNSIIASNSAPKNPVIYLDTGMRGSFRFNTVVSNGRAGRDSSAIFCGPDVERKPLESSLIVYNSVNAQTTQVDGRCDASTSVISDGRGGVLGEPAFLDPVAGDYHLQPSAATNLACCIDKVAWRSQGQPRRDADGRARAAGKTQSLGAYEPQR